MRVADFIGGVVVLLMGVGIMVFSAQLQYMSEFGPGPGFLPLWLGIGITACALGVLYQQIRKGGRSGAFFHPRTRIGMKMLAVIIGAFLLLPYLGFSVALAIFSFASMRLIGKHGTLLCTITAVATGVGVHYIFAEWLSIPLPTGVFDW